MKYMIELDDEHEVVLNRKLFLKWSKDCWVRGKKGWDFKSIKDLVDKELFASPCKEGIE